MRIIENQGNEHYTTASPKQIMSKSESSPGTDLKAMLKKDGNWTLPAIISLFIFILLYAPCMATVPAIAKETSWNYAVFGT